MKPSNDPRLHALAKSFHQLPEFPDEGGERGEFIASRSADSPLKHFSVMPGGRMVGARFFLRGRNRYVAYAPCSRQTDLLRFVDMMNMRLWKYRARAKHRDPEDTDLNFTVAMAQQDLDDFETERQDVIALIDAIEKHFLEIKLIVDANAPLAPGEDPRSRKTARQEFLTCHRLQLSLAEQRHQELLDLIAGVHEQLGEMAKRLDGTATVKVHPVEFPKDPINPEWEKLGPGADVRLPHEDDFKPLDVKPFAPGTVVEVPPMIFLPKPDER